jgi:hypothetical protein
MKVGMYRAALASMLMTACVSLCVGSADASSSDLAAFLERAERMATLTKPVRANITISRSDGSHGEAVLVVVPEEPAKQFMYLKSNGWKYLMPLGWGRGQVVKNGSTKPAALGPDEVIPGTDLRPMEFFAFWSKGYTTSFISDESRLEKTISLYAADAQPYSLYVVSFDKAKIVPLTIKYYRDNFTNLVRLRNNSAYKMVGGRPLPSKIVIQDYTENSTTTLELDWEVLEHVPEGLTDDKTFYEASLD